MSDYGSTPYAVAHTEASLAEWLDPRWRYTMQVPTPATFHPTSPHVPDETLTQVGRYVMREPPAELSVWGMVLDKEVDVRDWVQTLPLLHGKSIVPRTTSHRPQRSGTTADFELAWEERLSRRNGRLFARRVGQRLFVLLGSTTPRGFAALEGFDRSVASFDAEMEAEQPFAESMQEFRADAPFPWRVYLPASWVVLPNTTSDVAGGFQGRHVRLGDMGHTSMVGHISFTVIDRDAAKTPADVVKWYLQELDWAGLEVEPPEPQKEKPRRPFKGSWFGAGTLSYEDHRGDIRYRVLYHDRAWVIGGVVGVTREDDVSSWMQNKRALDILTASVALEPLPLGTSVSDDHAS